jgi:hypothetical protein
MSAARRQLGAIASSARQTGCKGMHVSLSVAKLCQSRSFFHGRTAMHQGGTAHSIRFTAYSNPSVVSSPTPASSPGRFALDVQR